MEQKHAINDFTESTVQKIREMIDVDTIVGNPITTPDGILVVPVSKVSFGFVSGGTDFTKSGANNPNFGCATGTGVSIKPVAFLVVKDGNVKLLNISAPAGTTLDRIVDMVPDVMEKISEWTGKDKE